MFNIDLSPGTLLLLLNSLPTVSYSKYTVQINRASSHIQFYAVSHAIQNGQVAILSKDVYIAVFLHCMNFKYSTRATPPPIKKIRALGNAMHKFERSIIP